MHLLCRYAKRSKDLRLEWIVFTKDYVLNRETLANVLLLIDASIPPTQVDLECANWLAGSHEPQGGEWTRQTARRRKAQHGKRVKPVSTSASKPAQIQIAKQAPRAKPSSSIKTSQNQLRDNVACSLPLIVM